MKSTTMTGDQTIITEPLAQKGKPFGQWLAGEPGDAVLAGQLHQADTPGDCLNRRQARAHALGPVFAQVALELFVAGGQCPPVLNRQPRPPMASPRGGVMSLCAQPALVM